MKPYLSPFQSIFVFAPPPRPLIKPFQTNNGSDNHVIVFTCEKQS